MNIHRELVLTAEITVTDGHIDGTVRAPGQPGEMFSGWSELFGALTRLVGEAGCPAADPDASSRGALGR
jgi:hypothetical protein